MTTGAVQTITDTQIKDAVAEIKKIDTNWRQTLCDKISASAAWKEYSNNPCTLSIIDHMASANVKGSSHRLIFLQACVSVLEDYTKRKKATEKKLAKYGKERSAGS